MTAPTAPDPITNAHIRSHKGRGGSAIVHRDKPAHSGGKSLPVGTGEPETAEQLSPIALRSFLLRGAESIQHSPYEMGATPKTTSGYDGTKDN